jgi:glycosyltransferase involved in cell wall biosynthesis
MHLTVVMPVYNAGPYVAEAVRSVLAQTYPDFVLHVIDDGSTDHTLAVAQWAAGRDRRVRVTSHANRGIANVMNAAVDEADTEWVACMHGDDVMLPRRLERQLAFVTENPDVEVASSIVDWIDDKGRVLGRSRSDLTTRKDVERKLAAAKPIAFPHPAVMFRRSAVVEAGGYRQDFWPAEDTELWNRVADRGPVVRVQPEVLMKYRLHGDSASMKKSCLMVKKLRWMERCIAARRAGRPEPTWAQFLAARRAEPWLVRLHESRQDLGRTMYQTAIGHYSAGRYHLLVPALAGAMALEPELVLPRMLPRLVKG